MKTLRICLFSLVAGVCACAASAQDIFPHQNEKGKWGYVDSQGENVIKYTYDEAEYFVDGRAKVRKGDNYGFIDTFGQPVIPLKYNLIEPWADGVYRVAASGKYKDGVLMDEKYGFISTDGTVILKPEYEEIGQFRHGVAYVHKGDKYGFIDEQFKMVIPCKYKAVGSVNDDGFVWVSEGCSFEKGSSSKLKGGKFGIYSKDGTLVVPVKYKTVGAFTPFVYKPREDFLKKLDYIHKTIVTESGSHKYLTKSKIPMTLFSKLDNGSPGFYGSTNDFGTKNAVYDKDGTLLIKEGKYWHALYPMEGLSVVVLDRAAQKYDFYNPKDETLLLGKKNYVNNAWGFYNGYAIVTKDEKSYLIDKSGSKVTKEYDIIYAPKEGVYVTELGDGFGMLSVNGKEILPPDRYAIYPMNGGLAYVREKKDGLAGYVNASGEYVIEPQFKAGTSFLYGMASVKTDNGWGEILPDGTFKVRCRWYNTTVKTHEGMTHLWVQKSKGGDWNALDLATDEIAFDKGYSGARNFGQDYPGVASVEGASKKCGVIDTNGNEVIPVEMDSHRMALDAYQLLLDSGKPKWEEIDSYRFRLYRDNDRNGYSLYSTVNDIHWDY